MAITIENVCVAKMQRDSMDDAMGITREALVFLLVESFMHCIRGRSPHAVDKHAEYLTQYWDDLTPIAQKAIHNRINDAIWCKYAGPARNVRQWKKILKLKIKDA